ncbi:MAG: hypothetical protein DMG67_13220, partial [Acidobacteria bacterium]
MSEAIISGSPKNYYDSGFTNTFQGGDVARPFYGNRQGLRDQVGIYAFDFCKGVFGITPAPNAALPGACNTLITPSNQLLSLNALNPVNSNNFIFTGPGTQPGQAPRSAGDVRFIINGATSQQVFGTPFGNVPRGALRDAPQNIFNLTISKQTKITERVGFEVHLTAINALNHFNFSNVSAFTEFAGFNTFNGGFAHPEFTGAGGRVVWLGA